MQKWKNKGTWFVDDLEKLIDEWIDREAGKYLYDSTFKSGAELLKSWLIESFIKFNHFKKYPCSTCIKHDISNDFIKYFTNTIKEESSCKQSIITK